MRIGLTLSDDVLRWNDAEGSDETCCCALVSWRLRTGTLVTLVGSCCDADGAMTSINSDHVMVLIAVKIMMWSDDLKPVMDKP